MFIGLGLSLTAIGRALDAYAIAGFSPKLVFDPKAGAYRTGGNASTFAGMIDYTGASNKTMVDSTGALKWAPHNLWPYSDYNALVSKIGLPTISPADGPEGSGTAYTVEDDNASGYEGITASPATIAGAMYTFEFLIEKTFGAITAYPLYQVDSGSGIISTIIDTTAGTLAAVVGAGTRTIESFNSEFWAVKVVYTATTTTSSKRVDFFPAASTDGIGISSAAVGSARVAALRFYRSDLGGMVDNPDTGDSYVPTTSAARYLSRRNHHVYEGGEWVNAGMLVEPAAATNLLLNSATLSTQNVTVTAVPTTLHFTGTGTVTLSGASTAGPLVGTGAGENNRVRLTFTPTAGTLTLTVSGTVTNAMLEVGSVPSSFVPTAGSTATRAAETVSFAAAKLPYSATAMSIAMRGRMTYADLGVDDQEILYLWSQDSSNLIRAAIATNSGYLGRVKFRQTSAGTIDEATEGAPGSYSPGINVPFSIASSHGSTFINGAVDGTALTADLTPTSLPNLSATNLSLAYSGGPMIIEQFTMFDTDLGDSGIAEASA